MKQIKYFFNILIGIIVSIWEFLFGKRDPHTQYEGRVETHNIITIIMFPLFMILMIGVGVVVYILWGIDKIGGWYEKRILGNCIR